RAARCETELACGFLLQRRSRERRRRAALPFLRLDVADDEPALRGLAQAIARVVRVALVREIELLEFLAVETEQSRAERLIRMRAVGLDRPVLARLERFDLFLALGDHAQRRRLHAARGQSALHLAPEHRRKVEADEIVEC